LRLRLYHRHHRGVPWPHAPRVRRHGLPRRLVVSSWNAVLAGLVELGRHEEAFELFDEMRVSGDVRALLTAAGEAVHTLSLKSGLETDLSVGNMLVGFYAGECF
jgi:pentatricopeptide repeat protein